jgi:release factor glutamine methyltransferase
MTARRMLGEPLAWITGRSRFCGVVVSVAPGVYVPRPQTELVARRAAARLPRSGVAVDVCTGSGAVAAALMRLRPGATVVASELDARAVACAHRNGVDVRAGDLLSPIPVELRGHVDVVVAVVPYVPTGELALLQRDTFTFESTLAYDGGPDGADNLRRVARDSVVFLRPGGALVLEMGGDQDRALRGDLERLGYGAIQVLRDQDGDVRGVEATLLPD